MATVLTLRWRKVRCREVSDLPKSGSSTAFPCPWNKNCSALPLEVSSNPKGSFLAAGPECGSTLMATLREADSTPPPGVYLKSPSASRGSQDPVGGGRAGELAQLDKHGGPSWVPDQAALQWPGGREASAPLYLPGWDKEHKVLFPGWSMAWFLSLYSRPRVPRIPLPPWPDLVLA